MAGPVATQKPLSPEIPHHLLRSPSAASDITIRSVYTSVPHINPAPAYVARDASSQLVASEIDRAVLISASALHLVNEFLDQVLYNILSVSRSTSLSALRAAVPSVLKPRLGKAALRVAEEELREYLNDDEETELQAKANLSELKHDFDHDLAWKLARLRCMVYTRLGDLEEEDEEEWLEKEGLLDQLQNARQTSHATVETGPASAIFLTSIVEYLGEQALYYATQHAQKRHNQHGSQQVIEEETEFADAPPSDDTIIVGGKDMNHVGRDSPLSRLWRSYRRNTRESSSRPISPDARLSWLTSSHSRVPSSVPQSAVILEERSPEQIPLPMSGRDIDEIEVPGLAPAFSDEEDEGDDVHEDYIPQKRRPASMIDMPGAFPGTMTPREAEPPEIPAKSPLRPDWLRKRSISTPIPTLGKSNSSRKGSRLRLDTLHSQSDLDVNQSDEARRPSLIRNQRSSQSGEGIFGGAVAAVAGALGLGALGISNVKRNASGSISNEPKPNRVEPLTPDAIMPKRTVAEEMLGAPSVAPPKDAKTSSSITNMSDFYSMHVPVAMASELSPALDTATPSTPKAAEYFPITTKAGPEPTPASKTVVTSQTGASIDASGENLRPAPLRTMSGRISASRPGTSDSGRSQGMNRNGDVSKPFLQAAPASRPQSSSSAMQALPTSNTPPRGVSKDSTQIRHVKADSYASVNSQHSRNSSTGNRPAVSVRDPNSVPQITSQQPATGPVIEDTRSVLQPSLNNARDARPETGNSSVSKRFHGKPLKLGDESDEAKKKSLEILIRGNETLHYTLTPAAALRDEQSLPQKNRTPTQDMADFLRNTGPPTQEQNARPRLAGVHSSSLEAPSSPKKLVPRVTTPSTPMGVVSPVSPTRTRNPLGEPRDARTEVKSSTRDLADYARSTGPNDAKQLPQSIGPRPASATSSKLTTSTPKVDASSRGQKTPTSSKPANRLKYQARDARPTRDDDTSGLIDFIREGPPSTGREHRIDRKVAPFRSTMDSDDFNNLDQGQAIITSLKESEDGHLAPSVDPSVNSQTPLIVSNGQSNRGVRRTSGSQMDDNDSDMMPKRTRRRIKDPYAIYDSDDDLDDEEASRASRNQEESLIDFLRSTAPPSEMKTQSMPPAMPAHRTTSQLQSSGARANSPHLTQSGSKMDKYRPTQPTHAAHVERNRAPQSVSTPSLDTSRPKPRFEARDAKATRVNTAELAEWLRGSGPPSSAQYRPQPFILSSANPQQAKPVTSVSAPKDEKNIFKRFSKSKK